MMKHTHYFILFFCFVLLTSCSMTECGCSPFVEDQSNLTHNKLSWDYNTDWESDPFEIVSVGRDPNDSTIMLVEVAYSGGCEEHTFEVIWPEVITAIYPPSFSIVLLHDAHNDSCEAYIHETLRINLINDQIPMSADEAAQADITVINGSENN